MSSRTPTEKVAVGMEKTAHLIGLCGAGMSAVAHLLQQEGYRVTGSDEGAYPPISDYLDRLGLECMIGHRAENIPSDPDLIVIGKHAKLVPEANAEVAHAFSHYRDRIRSFPEVLASLTADRRRMVVAGSYGKSTLTSLVAFCLQHAGRAPGWFIGALPNDLDHSSSLGGDGPFVFEGDEYPSANWDPSPKFSHYAPETVLLTSATHDHVNIYPTLASYHAPFQSLIEGLRDRDGMLIACTDELYAGNFFLAYAARKMSYGLEPGADFSAAQIVLGDPDAGTPTTFSLLIEREAVPGFTTTQMGRHAVQNICGAAAYLIGQGLLTVDEFRDGVAAFTGLARRLDRKVPNSPYVIYEGFGSSYEKARAAIEALKAHFPRRRLVVMFEPHTFTWRNRGTIGQYRSAFTGAETVYLYAPPDHGSGTHDQASLDEIAEAARAGHADIRTFDAASMPGILAELDAARDALLILSSGSFGGQLNGFLARAAES
jgi:UDP-N-acetylmuramate: L-alanyl-gamma-D-glutamyl-meso-diaminopimelate ligase